MKILFVEDNQPLAEQLIDALEDQRYTVELAIDGQQGWDFVQSSGYDLVLMDISLPKLDGVSLCRLMRVNGNQTPVLMLTAKSTSEDQILGLDSGADDYLVKPVSIHELSARIRALLRRGGAKSPPILSWGNLQLDPSTFQVKYADTIIPVTPREYTILELMLRNGQKVYSRSEILDRVWSYEDDIPREDTIKAHIKGLRNKLRGVGAADLIETVYGLGYRLNPEYYVSKQWQCSCSCLTKSQADLILEKLIHLAKRLQHPLCFALLNLKNQTQYDNLDTVIQQLTDQLQHQLKPEDIVAHTGKGQFMIGIYGIPREAGLNRLNYILSTLNQLPFKGRNQEITMSMGIVQYPEDGTDLRSLYRAAIAALK